MNARQRRLIDILERDGLGCLWCGYPLQLGDPDLTIEHVIPKVRGGPSWLENEVAACRGCNSRRRVQAPIEYAERCRERGLAPRQTLIITQLQALATAIDKRGGQRKARPYLRRELLRAERWLNADETARQVLENVE
jgi:hypothetical protein